MDNNEVINLLRCISKTSLDDADNKLFCNYINQFDNPSFLKLLEMHKIQFLFYKHIYDNGFLINKPRYKYFYTLGERFVYLQIKYNEYISEIKNLTVGLSENSIPYAILKGFSLIDSIYKFDNKIYRTFSDVDILVSKKNVSVFNKILEYNGYSQSIMNSDYEIHPADKSEKIYWRLNSHQEHEYIKKSRNYNYAPHLYLSVDVNFSIFKGGKYTDPISTETLLKHTRIRQINSVDFDSLDYTYELMQLCYHFYKDMFYDIKKLSHDNYNLIKFCDIREYIIKYKNYIKWDKLLLLLKENQLEQEIASVLFLVSNFYKDLNIDDLLSELKGKNIYDQNICWEELLL